MSDCALVRKPSLPCFPTGLCYTGGPSVTSGLLVEGTRDRFRDGVRAAVERIAADDLDAAREAISGEIARRRQMREAGGAFVESLVNTAPRRRGQGL